MVLTLDFSKMVNIGKFLFEKNMFTYQHDFYIVEDSQERDKYYLINHIRNVSKIKNFDNLNSYINNIPLEEIYILDLSLKKDIPMQIACFLKSENYLNDINEGISVLNNIDISYFEIRYKFYERSRNNNIDFIELDSRIYCNYSKFRVVNENNTLGTIVEDIGLRSVRKLLNLR